MFLDIPVWHYMFRVLCYQWYLSESILLSNPLAPVTCFLFPVLVKADRTKKKVQTQVLPVRTPTPTPEVFIIYKKHSQSSNPMAGNSKNMKHETILEEYFDFLKHETLLILKAGNSKNLKHETGNIKTVLKAELLRKTRNMKQYYNMETRNLKQKKT